MTTVRFLSPEVPQLELPGVPAVFVNGVFDIEDTETDRISRMRYLGTPYGVSEMGAIDESAPGGGISLDAVVAAVNTPASALSQALARSFLAAADLSAVTDDLASVKQQVASLTDAGGGSRVVGAFGNAATYDASSLPDWTLVVLMSSDPTA